MKHPLIWILSQGRLGDLEQMLALAQALGWPFAVKQLDFRPPAVPFLAPWLLKRRAGRAPPWPDLVLCAEAMVTRIAVQLRQKSGGKAKLVCLGRPAGYRNHFDLVLTTAQYRLRPAANVVELALPLGSRSGGEACGFPVAPGGGGRPEASRPCRITVLVGGTSFPDRLDGATALALAQNVLAYAAARSGVLQMLTSPRTGADAVRSLRQVVTAPHRLHVYGESPDNPYRDLLAAADEIIVTSDSVSMAAEAIGTGKAVSLYALPCAGSLKLALSDWCRRHVLEAEPVPPLLRPFAWLFDHGVLETTADRRHLVDRLIREGRISRFGSPAAARQTASGDDMALALKMVRARFTGH